MNNSIPVRKTVIYQEVPRSFYLSYQEKAWQFNVNAPNSDYFYYALLEEKGEALGVLAKAIRAGIPIDREKLKEELGDVLWNIAAIATTSEQPFVPSTEYSGTFNADYINRLAEAYRKKLVSKKRIQYAIDFVRCLAAMFELDLQTIMMVNIEKLENRRLVKTIAAISREDKND